jgi:hypothetical protein
VNVQQATSGDLSVEGNTNAGNVSSGAASNQSTTTTTLVVGDPVVGDPGQGQGQEQTPGSDAVGGSGASQGNQSTTTTTVSVTSGSGSGGQSRVLGSSTSGGMGGALAVLPQTGASTAMDVSGLRAGTHADSPASNLVKQTRGTTALLLALAVGLALLAAVTSVYARRKLGRI